MSEELLAAAEAVVNARRAHKTKQAFIVPYDEMDALCAAVAATRPGPGES